MYSFPNLEPVHCSISSSNYCFLTCMQISQEAGQMVWYSHLLKNFPVCCDPHSQGVSVVSEAEVGVFLEFSSFFYDPTDVGSLFSGGSDSKEYMCNEGDLGLIPGSGRSLGEGKGNSLQYSCLENSMVRGAWQATVLGVAKTRLSE